MDCCWQADTGLWRLTGTECYKLTDTGFSRLADTCCRKLAVFRRWADTGYSWLANTIWDKFCCLGTCLELASSHMSIPLTNKWPGLAAIVTGMRVLNQKVRSVKTQKLIYSYIGCLAADSRWWQGDTPCDNLAASHMAIPLLLWWPRLAVVITRKPLLKA